MKKSGMRLAMIYIATVLSGLLIFWISIHTGGIEVSAAQLFRGLFLEYDQDVAIIWQLRFPRIFMALLGGALMAASGVCMQAVLRNPLADPGIIGISSGAAFAAVVISAFFPGLAVFMPFFSFAGGMAAFGAVYVLSWNRERNPVRLLLTGIAVDAFFTGLYQAFGTMSGLTYSGAASVLNANISLKTWEDVRMLLVYGLVSAVLCVPVISRCNLLALSDKTVTGLGIDIDRMRIFVSVVSVFMASVFTAMIGAVGFLGLIVPHMARILVGSDHKVLLPYSALLGAVLFLLADTVGRSIAYPYEISSAIIMSIVGGPVLVVLLKRSGTVYGA